MRDFLSKVYNVELNNYKGVCVIAQKGDATFKEKRTGGLKNNIKNLVGFHGSRQKSDNFHFDGAPLSIAYVVSAKKVQKSYPSL